MVSCVPSTVRSYNTGGDNGDGNGEDCLNHNTTQLMVVMVMVMGVVMVVFVARDVSPASPCLQ